MAGGCLAGVRVVDVSRYWAGPHCTELLADMGAEVIKVEPPTGDPMRGSRNPVRGSGTYPNGEPGDKPYNRAGVFNQLHRNKRSVIIDLTVPRGKDVFKELVRRGHVVTDNFKTGTMDKLGLGYEVLKEVNPSIIVIGLPAFGATGPQKGYLGYGINLEPHSGFSSLTGYYGEDVPRRSGVDHMDPLSGTHAAGAIVAALLYTRRTGKGTFIDFSHMESAINVIGEAIMDYTMNGRVQGRLGNRHPYMAPHGCYRCQGEDNWVTISVSSDAEWDALCRAMGSPTWTKDERFADSFSRWQHQNELDPLIETWTCERENYQVMYLLQKIGCPAGAVLSVADLIRDPQLRERGFFPEVTHPEAGTLRVIGPRWKASRTPPAIERPAPCFAQDNDYVFREILGLSDAEVDQLYKERITFSEPVWQCD